MSHYWQARRPWRTIRGPKANYKVAYYTTQERRDAAAQRDANKDGDTVLCEIWTEEQMQTLDPINDGWALDAVKEPTCQPAATSR